MSSLKLKTIEYKPELGLAMALVLAAIAFIGTMYLGLLSFQHSIYITIIALFVGALFGFSQNTSTPALGTTDLALASKPTKLSNDLENAAKIIQQASALLNNVKASFNSATPPQAIDYNAVSSDLATVMTPVLQKHFGPVTQPAPAKPSS